MARIKGPHTVEFGADTLTNIEEIDVEYETDTSDYSTVQGNKFVVDNTQSVTATLTLLTNDVPSMRVVLPSYFVANGGTLSTGETVTDADGAIDIVPEGCVDMGNLKHLTITSCDETGAEHTLRLTDVSTRIEGIEFDGPGARKVMVQFRGEGATVAQFFSGGAPTTIS